MKEGSSESITAKIKKMFVPDYSESIPGYTGHRQEQLKVEADTQQPGGPRKHIPGYGGYVPGVKSENVFGQTYGKTSNIICVQCLIVILSLSNRLLGQTNRAKLDRLRMTWDANRFMFI